MKPENKKFIFLIFAIFLASPIVHILMTALHFSYTAIANTSGILISGLLWMLCYKVYKTVYMRSFLWRYSALCFLVFISAFCILLFLSNIFPTYIPIHWQYKII